MFLSLPCPSLPCPACRYEGLSWLFFQMGGVGPMFGQFGHFYKYARDKCDHPYPVERYGNEAKRLLGVLEGRLEGREFILDFGYSIVDMATFPWVVCLEVSRRSRDWRACRAVHGVHFVLLRDVPPHPSQHFYGYSVVGITVF